ncbi:malonyl-[acyl-carrier protein] O-methyltransferase BioC [Methyloglobulus morosus KoM1]|uniref:Malonyl-[acyl-carrier protein] O-methyltransferase n=1 Tax=Methyloglobulus morosus KoM1 TaxID=1116472 RepID=V5BWT0_9GAMM|nr:malonyl-ACP O-methyltransferase BioC [Methyloglobulus morosus]ESS72314.1 malonyl-[acyl-carrier protein] O-methyltransferase BioC [Methyloglobulus morosus KoM1]
MRVKTKIKQSFAMASTTYDSVALLQQKVGGQLIQRIGNVGRLDTVIDIGCGTGFVVNEILGRKHVVPEQIVALDIALPMLLLARSKLKNNNKVTFLCADAEYLPLQAQSADLVISNLAFQWCNNLEKTLADIKRILRSEGQFYFTTFGQQTLSELRYAWQEVDDYAHVNTFVSAGQLTDYLYQVGFKQVEVETCTYISTYESVWDLMAELKQWGAHTVLEGCNKQLTRKSAMQRMICAYQQQDKNGLVSATFEVITAAARV